MRMGSSLYSDASRLNKFCPLFIAHKVDAALLVVGHGCSSNLQACYMVRRNGKDMLKIYVI